MRSVILYVVFLGSFLTVVIGQNPIISNDSIVIVERTLKKINKNISFTIVPGPTFGSSQKLGFAVLPMIVYNLKKADTVSPPSSTAVLIYFDFYGSWVTAVKQSFYWNQNKWRAFITVGVGDLEMKYYGVGRDTAIINNDDSNYVWTEQKEFDVVVTCFRKIYKGLYGGLESTYSLYNYQGTDSVSTAELQQSDLPIGKQSLFSLAPTFVWDNRDNVFWSTKGYYASVNLQLSNKLLFNSTDYTIISGFVNGYHNLSRHSQRLTLAWHFFAQSAWGELPYRVYANYCRGDEATGYTSGKYVNLCEATVQTELRYDLWKFIALGGYVGTGKTFPTFSVFGQSEWLHYTGVRLYLNIIPYRNIRLKLEAAKGRKDWGVYIGIGQGF